MQFERAVEFTPSKINLFSWLSRQRLKHRVLEARPTPEFHIFKPCELHSRWTLFFVYAPTGSLSRAQKETINRLKLLNRKLLIVCATSDINDIPPEVQAHADALIWKELLGYDFSAYGIGLRELAQRSPGADVFVLNDSVYGPFFDISPLIDEPAWDLTGFAGSNQIEKHFQSYAFILRHVTHARMADLQIIFPSTYCYNARTPVVMNFETRLARVASQTMSVGMLWFAPCDDQDPTLDRPFDLIENGFPFLKKGLLGINVGRQNPERVRSLLCAMQFPE